ncbi:NUCLEOLAR COMPLEX ASSOCIATED 4-like protein [Drosera capensis]
MAAQSQGNSGADLFDLYFKRADLDNDGRISGAEAVGFFLGSNLPKQILAQIWTYADQNRLGYLGRAEFYNALKLVTVAQSKRVLTPDIVKAALYGPASAKIPAPQIGFPSTAPNQSNATAVPPPPQIGTYPTPPPNPVIRGATPTPSNVNISQLYNQPPLNESVRPPLPVSGIAARSVQPVGFQVMPGGGSALGANAPNSQISTDAPGGKFNGPLSGSVSQFPVGASNLLNVQSGSVGQATSLPPRPPAASWAAPSPTPIVQPKSSVSVNGYAANPLFGAAAFSANSTESGQGNRNPAPSGNSVPSPLVDGSASHVPQNSTKKDSPNFLQNSLSTQPAGGPLHTVQSVPKQNQQVYVQSSSGAPRPPSAVNMSQMHWPKLTHSDVQKYTKVFVEVDRDKDGKITGLQARNLFLSWRLPREVLKQVWDLSDQDNDSMLTLKEFCIALYLMERYRDGRPLPPVLPSSVMIDLAVAVQASGQGGGAWGFTPGLQQQQATSSSAARQVPRPAGKPPLPVHASTPDERQGKPQKAKVPVLEKHLVDQLSEEEQKSLVSKFQEATEANKKVEELEKEIKESRERIETFRARMQELVLYKSRCDSRLNEIMERAAADKREVESLAKKYEEKYRQAGNVASKLTLEEATFRDIQERKMELYKAIVKMEQEGDSDGGRQARADGIQSSLEELVKSLGERCKKYGLRGKPTTLLELPFGWQPGIQEGAADWDEEWDKFEDEGFTIVKELTLDVQSTVAPPKTKSIPVKNETAMEDDGETSSNAIANGGTSSMVEPESDAELEEKTSTIGERSIENGSAEHQNKDISARSQTTSPVVGNSHDGPLREVIDNSGGSPHAGDSQSNHGGEDHSFSGDNSFSDPAWGNFDSRGDADSVWDFNPSSRGMDHERHADDDLFGPGQLGLNPIKTGSVHTEAGFRRGSSVFADSVPSTPLYTSNYSPKRYGEGSEEHGFNLSRFDSFRSTESGFQPQETLARFDSMRSTQDFDYGHGLPSFDDSDPFGAGPFKSSFTNETPRRDSDPFGSAALFTSAFGNEIPRTEDGFDSVGAFRSSFGETPRRDSDSFAYGGAFSSSFGGETPRIEDPFGSVGPFASSFGSETPRSDYSSVGPFRPSLGSETPRSDYDPFGSSGPFRSSFTSETPRRDSEPFSGPFKSPFTSETPRGFFCDFRFLLLIAGAAFIYIQMRLFTTQSKYADRLAAASFGHAAFYVASCIHTLRHHCSPAVSRFVSSLEIDLTVRAKTTEVVIKDFSSASYATIFADEMRRRVKQVPVAFHKVIPTSLFSESDFPGWSFKRKGEQACVEEHEENSMKRQKVECSS